VKKTFSAILLSLLLLQAAGCYVFFFTRLMAIRIEMREQLKFLPDHELTLLTFTAAEFKNAKVNDHEVKVNGHMYDIARIVTKKNQVLVYAKQDEAEDNLLSFLNEIVKRSTHDKKPVPSQLLHWLTLVFVSPENCLPQNKWTEVNHTSVYMTLVSDHIHSIESPPPQR
jgi:hypothetical protein